MKELNIDSKVFSFSINFRLFSNQQVADVYAEYFDEHRKKKRSVSRDFFHSLFIVTNITLWLFCIFLCIMSIVFASLNSP